MLVGATTMVLPTAVPAKDVELEFLAQLSGTRVSLVGGGDTRRFGSAVLVRLFWDQPSDDRRAAGRTLTPFLLGCDDRWISTPLQRDREIQTDDPAALVRLPARGMLERSRLAEALDPTKLISFHLLEDYDELHPEVRSALRARLPALCERAAPEPFGTLAPVAGLKLRGGSVGTLALVSGTAFREGDVVQAWIRMSTFKELPPEADSMRPLPGDPTLAVVSRLPEILSSLQVNRFNCPQRRMQFVAGVQFDTKKQVIGSEVAIGANTVFRPVQRTAYEPLLDLVCWLYPGPDGSRTAPPQDRAAGPQAASVAALAATAPETATVERTIIEAATPDRPAIVQERRGIVRNTFVEGQLQATQSLRCMPLSQALPSYTPPDLLTAVVDCLAAGESARAAGLYLLAKQFAIFDAARVGDTSARGGMGVLRDGVFSALDSSQLAVLSSVNSRLRPGSSTLRETCTAVAKVGPPSYFPRYLVLHGLRALGEPKPLENALVEEFDGPTEWQRVTQKTYGCPGEPGTRAQSR